MPIFVLADRTDTSHEVRLPIHGVPMLPRLSFLQRLAVLALLALAACTPVGPQLIGNPQNPYPPANPPRVGDIVHLPTGTPVTIDQLSTSPAMPGWSTSGKPTTTRPPTAWR